MAIPVTLPASGITLACLEGNSKIKINKRNLNITLSLRLATNASRLIGAIHCYYDLTI